MDSSASCSGGRGGSTAAATGSDLISVAASGGASAVSDVGAGAEVASDEVVAGEVMIVEVMAGAVVAGEVVAGEVIAGEVMAVEIIGTALVGEPGVGGCRVAVARVFRPTSRLVSAARTLVSNGSVLRGSVAELIACGGVVASTAAGVAKEKYPAMCATRYPLTAVPMPAATISTNFPANRRR